MIKLWLDIMPITYPSMAKRQAVSYDADTKSLHDGLGWQPFFSACKINGDQIII